MARGIPVILILAWSLASQAIAEKYETFEDSNSSFDHGWSTRSESASFVSSISPTSRAEGKSGPNELEIMIHPQPFHEAPYFADTRLGGVFTLDDDFFFSGKLRLEGLDPDDSMQIVIGFFDSSVARQPLQFGKVPHIGIVIGSGYGNPDRIHDGHVGVGYSLSPFSGAWRAFSPEFNATDPMPISMQFTADNGFGGGDHLTSHIGSQSLVQDVVNYGDDNPTFDAFGVLVWGSSFDEVTDITIVLDDLRYSTRIPEPTSLTLLAIACFGFVQIRRR